jgi:hypothetical protein
MAKINVDIQSTLDKSGFDATAKAVKNMQGEINSASMDFSKMGNVSGVVTSAISGDVKGVSSNLFGLSKSLQNVGGAIGGLAKAAVPFGLIATVAVGAYQAIKSLGEKIKKAREEAEAARIAKQAQDLKDLADAYGEATKQVERYAKGISIAAENAIKLQSAGSGLQNAKLNQAMNAELANTPADKQDAVKTKYSRFAQDLKDAQALRAIELEMSKNQAEIAKQEKLASEAARFYNTQLEAKNKLISDTAKKIASGEGFTGSMNVAITQAAGDKDVSQAVNAEKSAKAAAEAARNELARLKAAQDVLKVKREEIKVNSETARQSREIEDKAKLEKEHEQALNEALKKKNELVEKVAQAENALKKTVEAEAWKTQNKELQKGLELLNQQVQAAKELLGIANQNNGGKGRVANIAEAEKQAAKEAKELDRQRKADAKRLAAIEKRSLGGKFGQDVNGDYYLRSMTGEDITKTLRGKDLEFVRRLNELNAAERTAKNAEANKHAIQEQIEAGNKALAGDAVEAAEDAVEAAKAEAEAAQEAVDDVENKFAKDLVSLEESFANYQSELQAKIAEINAPAVSAVETLNSNFADLKITLKNLLTAN